MINIVLYTIIAINLMFVTVGVTTVQRTLNTKATYLLYQLNLLTIVWWVAEMSLYRISDTTDSITLNLKLLYIAAAFIASSFYIFTKVFLNEKIHKSKFILIFATNIFIVLLIIFSNRILISAESIPLKEHRIIFGNYYFIYVAYILYVFNCGFVNLFRNYKLKTDTEDRKQILSVFVGYTIAGFISFITNLLLPWMGYFEFNWIGQISSIIMIFSISYAVLKYKLFNFKVLFVDILISSLWLITLVKMFAYNIYYKEVNIIELAYMTLIVASGIIILRNIKNEIRQKEINRQLAEQLSEANAKLKELDDIKTSFVTLASHNMSTPLTTIKGYVSLLREDGFEYLDQKTLKEKYGLRGIDYVMDNLTTIIRDFLDISQIELNTLSNTVDSAFNVFSSKVEDSEMLNIIDVVDEILYDLHFYIKNNNLTISLITPHEYIDKYHFTHLSDGSATDTNNIAHLIPAHIHYNKASLKKSLYNILENSIRNSKDSTISIQISYASESHNSLTVEIRDSGERPLPKISKALVQTFSREGKDSEAYLIGKGLGVYVARKILEARNSLLNIDYIPQQHQWKFTVTLHGAQ